MVNRRKGTSEVTFGTARDGYLKTGFWFSDSQLSTAWDSMLTCWGWLGNEAEFGPGIHRMFRYGPGAEQLFTIRNTDGHTEDGESPNATLPNGRLLSEFRED